MRQKIELPSKVCETCGRSFVWRKKWRRDWESVKYCSAACRKPAGAVQRRKDQGTCDPEGSQEKPG